MSSRLSFVFAVVFFLAATVYGQNAPSVHADLPVDTTVKTNGILGAIYPYLWPVSTLIYQTLDSVLRNVRNESLPCTIYDFTDLNIVCTPL